MRTYKKVLLAAGVLLLPLLWWGLWLIAPAYVYGG